MVDGKGNAYPVQKEYAWSMAPEGQRADQGWGIAVQSGRGKLLVPSLGGNQPYVTWVYTDRGIYIVKHLQVKAHQTATYRLNVDGPKTVDLETLPARGAVAKATGKQPAPCSITTAGKQVTFVCKVPTHVAKNTVATLSGYKYGRWIPLHRAQVQANHTVRLTSPIKYVGTEQWRIDAGSVREGFTVSGRA